jgi:hypothetical protein
MVQGPGSDPLVLVRIEDAAGIRTRTLLSSSAPPLQLFLDGGPGAGVGDGGDGGSAEVLYDGYVPDCQRRVQIINRGGPGVRAGRPGAIPRETAVSGEKLFREELSRGLKLYQQAGSSGTTTGI